MPQHFRVTLAMLTFCLLLLCGCPRRTSSTTGPESGKPFVLGDLVEKFEPPSLTDLEKTVAESGGWVNKPVLDGMVLMRERQASEKPLATVKEALSLHNNSDESNAKIASALGRLPKSDADVNFEAVITRTTPQQLNKMNPLLASTVTEQEVSGLTGFGLFNFDWDFNPFASSDAVVSWQTSKNGLYDKVVMRDDLVWSDGQPITAHDIEFSFKVIMSSDVPVPAMRSGTDKLRYVKAYDDHTVVFFHKESLATNVWNVNFSVIPKHVYEKSIADDPKLTDSDYHNELERNPVIGGGYEVKKRDETEISLNRRESAYKFDGKQVRDKPYFKSIRLRIIPDPSVQLLGLQGGDIDEMMLTPSQWVDQTNSDDFYLRNTKARGLEWTSFSFQYNIKSPFFTDERVRWAFTYAFDHEEMLKTFRKGLDEPCTGTFHPTSRWYPSKKNAIHVKIEPIKQNLEKAKQLLDEAGWKDSDGDGYRDKLVDGKKRKFEFNIIVRSDPDRVDLCELLKQNLRLVGIACNIQSLESASLQDKMFEKQFDAAFGGWGTGADPDTSVNIYGTGEDRNFGNYSNAMVDELFVEGRKLDQDRKSWKELKVWKDEKTRVFLQLDDALVDSQPAREDCYAAIHALMWRDQPYTWLYYRNAFHGFNKQVRGYNFSPRGVTGYSPGFSSWHIPAAL